MKRLLAKSLCLAALALSVGCGSDSASNPSGGSGNFSSNQVYQGFIMGRVALLRDMQPGPVEILTSTGQLLHTAQAGKHGFFWYRGILPPDFRVRAQRGADTFESEYHGGWSGGTLYVNAATTLSCAYQRAHPEWSQQQAEERIRSSLRMPSNIPMSWVSTVRTPGFNTKAYFQAARPAGVNAFNNILIAKMDAAAAIRPAVADTGAEVISSLLSATAESIGSSALNDAIGDSVANMGFNFTTAGALATIEGDLAVVSQQISDLDSDFKKFSAAAALQSTLIPLQNNAAVINNSVVNITQTIGAYIQSHPNDSDYNVPSTYPPLQDVISSVQSLDLKNLSDPIASSLTDTSSSGIYQLLLKQQMTEIGQDYDTRWNNYPWRNNLLTEAQTTMMGSFVTSLIQASYLQAEYANLQTDNLATELTKASEILSQNAYNIQVASQQVPDLLVSDEVSYDPINDCMWYNNMFGKVKYADAGDIAINLVVGPYYDWGIPTQGQLDALVKQRIGTATNGAIDTNSGNTWGDVSSSVWINAFGKMGFNADEYASEFVAENSKDNEGAWFTSGAYDSNSTNSDNINLYEWNNTGSNPSTRDADSADYAGSSDKYDAYTNLLLVRQPGYVEKEAAAYLPDALLIEPPTGETAAFPHQAAPVVGGLSPFGLPIINEHGTNPLPVSVDGVPLGTQLQGLARMQTKNTAFYYASINQNYTYDITRRMAWTSTNPSMASISNFLGDPSIPYTSTTKGPGPIGFVTWHPPLDGSPLTGVTINASHFSFDPIGGQLTPQTWTIDLTPPDNCHPILTEVYACPNNQMIDVSTGAVTQPISLIATYRDGRVFDVANDPNTTWSLHYTDGSGNSQTINSTATGGFGLRTGDGKNVLYLSNGIPASQVTYTATYTANINGHNWGTQTFSGKMGLIKQGVVIDTMLPAVGPAAGGQTVVIKGQNFTDGTFVTFGGVPATRTIFVSPTQLSVTTPPGSAGTVPVVVTAASGAQSTPLNYTYTN